MQGHANQFHRVCVPLYAIRICLSRPVLQTFVKSSPEKLVPRCSEYIQFTRFAHFYFSGAWPRAVALRAFDGALELLTPVLRRMGEAEAASRAEDDGAQPESDALDVEVDRIEAIVRYHCPKLLDDVLRSDAHHGSLRDFVVSWLLTGLAQRPPKAAESTATVAADLEDTARLWGLLLEHPGDLAELLSYCYAARVVLANERGAVFDALSRDQDDEVRRLPHPSAKMELKISMKHFQNEIK